MAIILGYSHVGSAKCLKACTETFKASIVQIVGPSVQSETELLAPFHSIIAKSRTNMAANRKIEWICFAVGKFDTCSKRCPQNNAKALRMASILQWNTICNLSKEDPKAFTEFVNCERHHIEKTSRKCNFVKVNEQMALKDFCKQLADYSACYASVPFECSSKASDVWLTINHAVQKSFNVILQLSSQHLRLPPECQASMATTLPSGILTTHHPPLITTSSSLTTVSTASAASTVSSTTPMPLYLEDSSTVDDYSYFTQTDDYKYFGIDKESTTTPDAPRTDPGSIDYWVDLGEEPTEALEKPNQSHSQRHVEPPKNLLEEDEDEIIFAEPARFETKESITTTTRETTFETSQITRAPVPLNSGNFTGTQFQYHEDKSIYEILDELIVNFEDYVGIIIIGDDYRLKADQLEPLTEKRFKKYGNLVYLATKEELEYEYYLTLKDEYSVGDMILKLGYGWAIVYQCTDVTKGRVIWKMLHSRYYGLLKYIKSAYIKTIVGLKTTHLVLDENSENYLWSYSSEFDINDFKSTNYIKDENNNLTNSALLLARYILCDQKVSTLVKIEHPHSSSTDFTIQDWGFIRVPKAVHEYRSRTNVMGIDLGSARSVLAVSRDKQINVIPFNNLSPGSLWTESIVSFDEDKLIIGKEAITKLETKPNYVIFDIKILSSWQYQKRKLQQEIWPFWFGFKKQQPYLEMLTYNGLEELSFGHVNKILLEQMVKASSKYQTEVNNGELVRKAVITIPSYFQDNNAINPMISYVIQAAKLSNIKIIDIIEETHADLLYYMSNEKYSDMIKPGMKIAIFDIGAGNCTSRIYEISEHEGKRYATCFRELDTYDDAKWSGRDIDDIIMKKLEKSISTIFRNIEISKMLETAEKIKHDLCFQETIKFDTSNISEYDKNIVEFTREWLEENLEAHFDSRKSFYNQFKKYPLPTQREDRCRQEKEDELNSPLDDVEIVFLAGGTCRIPFIKRWIEEQFPKANIFRDEPQEIITATGAVIHALQVLNEEVKPYIKVTEYQDNVPIINIESSDDKMGERDNGLVNLYLTKQIILKYSEPQHLKTNPIICSILSSFYEIVIGIYDTITKEETHSMQSKDKSLPLILDELIKEYKNNIKIIVITSDSNASSKSIADFKKKELKDYGDLVYVAETEEIDFHHYLNLKTNYSIGDFIIRFNNRCIALYKCKKVVKDKVIWKEMERKENKFSGHIDFEHIKKLFHLKGNNFHIVSSKSQEMTDLLSSSKLHNYGFKSTNFIDEENKRPINNALIFARYILRDPEISMFVKIKYSDVK